MAIIEVFGAAKKHGFIRQVQTPAQIPESPPEKVPSAMSPSIPAVVSECKLTGAGSGGLTAYQLMLKIHQEEIAVSVNTPGKAGRELKETQASVPDESPAAESSETAK